MKKLRVWWIPQVPMSTPFYREVSNLKEASLLLDTLADYDMFQFENNIKPDYSNAGGLEMFDTSDDESGAEINEWTDWYNDIGDDFDDHRRYCEAEGLSLD